MDFVDLIEIIPSDLGEVAQFLTGVAAFALVLSWGYERWAWFQNLTGRWKKRLVFLTAFFLPLIGYGIGYAFWAGDPGSFPIPGIPINGSFGIWAQFLWSHFLYSLLVYAGTQYAHSKDPAVLDVRSGAAPDKHLLLG